MAVASLPQAYGQASQYASSAGVFAKVDIETAKTTCKASTDGTIHYQECIHKLFEDLFKNPVISGLTVGERWDNIEVSSDGCQASTSSVACYLDHRDWEYLDDAFSVANEHGKSVELILTPGVDTPLWVFALIPSCDGLFPRYALTQHDCGKVTLKHFQQQQRADSHILPLPWNSVYRSHWHDFLLRVRNRYNTSLNPAFVAIAVTRPNGASDEIIYPTTAWGGLIGPGPGVPADTAWPVLIQHSFPNKGSDFWNSDQAIVNAWTDTIDDYESIFSGISLVLSPDAGNYLPELQTTPVDQNLYNLECARSSLPNSCAAKTNILDYFIYHYQDGPNAKATRVGGMTASSPVSAQDSQFGIGIGGVKLLTQMPLPSSLQPAPALVGGAEFDHPISAGKNIQQTGCPDWKPNNPNNCDVTTEEAAFYVLTVFFHGTPAAPYWGGSNGVGAGKCGATPAPVQFLEVPFLDVQNALTLPPPTTASTILGLGTTSLEDLLTMASQDLLAMAKNQGTILYPCE